MTESKECILCGTIYYKRQTCSKKERAKSKFCSKECNIKNFNKAGSDATRGKKLSEEEKKKPNYFQKGHKNSGLKYLKKWRKEGGVVWNRGKYGYRLTKGQRKTDLNKLIRTSQKYLNRRKSIFKRDNWTCVECGRRSKKGDKVYLNVHHIKPFYEIISQHNICSFEDAYDCKELRDINNGHTLCRECHKQTDSFLVNQHTK